MNDDVVIDMWHYMIEHDAKHNMKWLGVTSLIEKLWEGRLWCFEHVCRRLPIAHVRRVESVNVDDARMMRGQSRRKWEDSMKLGVKMLALTKDMTLYIRE